MNVSNDSPSVNFVDYFTKQLPIELDARVKAFQSKVAALTA